MTEKLFWEDAYKTKFIAKITEVYEDGVILDKTLFYPESGNQVSDRGYLSLKDEKFIVEKVSKDEDDILHHISSDFKNKIQVGDEVDGEIDWEYRYGIMKAHTSQHIFSAVAKNKLNLDTVRANLSYEEVFLQFSNKIDYQQLDEILIEVNKICTSNNLKVRAQIISQKEAEEISKKIRSAIPGDPDIRLMEIKDLDLVCCGGTHIKNTTEIGNVYIYDFKKGTEIKYIIGNTALLMNSKNNIDLIKLANYLNSPLEKTNNLINKRLEFLDNIQEENKELSIQLLESISKSPVKVINNISLFYIGFNVDIKLLNKALDNFPQNSIIIVKFEKNKIRILSLNEIFDSNKLLNKLIERYGGKGGGNPKSSQGFLKLMPDDIISEVESLIFNH